MIDAVALSLPIAVALAVAATPVVVVALVLVTARPPAVGRGFAAGWFLGIAAAAVVLTIAVDTSAPRGLPPMLLAVVRLAVGALLWWLAWRSWRARASVKTPGWMAGLSTWSTGRAFTVGLGLGSLNPKNLALVVAGVAVVVEATSVPGEQAVALTVFAVVASSGVALPVLLQAVGGEETGRRLTEAQGWMSARANLISAVVLAILGAVVLGNGVAEW